MLCNIIGSVSEQVVYFILPLGLYYRKDSPGIEVTCMENALKQICYKILATAGMLSGVAGLLIIEGKDSLCVQS